MADWPDVDELKRVLNVDPDAQDDPELNTVLTRVLAAAVRRVKSDVGQWVEATDVPNENMAQAALRMAELVSERPSAGITPAIAKDPAYLALLFGQRRSFGIG